MKIKANNENYSIENLQRIVVYGDGVILYDNPEGYFQQYNIIRDIYCQDISRFFIFSDIKSS
jgi:hypothetical protein